MVCIFARSPFEVGMVTPSEYFVNSLSEQGVGVVEITPDVFARVTRWCMCGSICIWYGDDGVDDVWLVVVGMGGIIL